MRRALLPCLAAGLIMAGCGGGPEPTPRASASATATKSPCGPAPEALATTPNLPPDFPTPDEVTYTAISKAGPTDIVEGYFDGDLDTGFDAYVNAFPDAGYTVTREDHEEDEAEVNYEGGGSNGQVKLEELCEGRTDLRITIRPS